MAKVNNVDAKIAEDLKEENKVEELTGTVVEQNNGKLRKILMGVGAGLAFIATGVVSFILGRNSAGDDDDEGNNGQEGSEE